MFNMFGRTGRRFLGTFIFLPRIMQFRVGTVLQFILLVFLGVVAVL